MLSAMLESSAESARRPGDLRISITTENELRYWTKALACSEEQLRGAISSVGPLVFDVRDYLRLKT